MLDNSKQVHVPIHITKPSNIPTMMVPKYKSTISNTEFMLRNNLTSFIIIIWILISTGLFFQSAAARYNFFQSYLIHAIFSLIGNKPRFNFILDSIFPYIFISCFFTVINYRIQKTSKITWRRFSFV